MPRRRRNETLLRALGARIRAERDARGWSRERLAADADLDPSTIAKVEAGTLGISLTALADLARALAVPMAALLVEPPVGHRNLITPRSPESEELMRLAERCTDHRRALLVRVARELAATPLTEPLRAIQAERKPG